METMKNRQQRKRKIRKWLCRTMAILFAGIVCVLAVVSLIKPDRKYSDEENRVLAGFPKLSAESLMDKDYMTGLEDYTSDQFVLRDLWIRLKVQADLLMGKREFNGVYLGKKKQLIQALANPDEENVKKNLEAINAFAAANEDANVNLMLVPNAAYVLEDYLPKGAPVRDQAKDLKSVQGMLSEDVGFINVTDTLKKHTDEGLYYKTDHHWTSRGAALGFEASAEALGIEHPLTDYDVYTVATDFSGTLASTSGYHKAKDTVEIYAPKDVEIQYLVSDSDNEEKRPTVYDRSALEKKDKYQVFFGGNHAMVDIVTANETQKRLLVFKDSYANCFIPFLLPYYNEIVMIDPRYYYDNVQNVVDNKGITDILFLYNADTFLTDNSLADVLASE